jgi:hypothetical protein
MKIQTKTIHLGLIRTTSNETKINIEERIGLARRMLYSLIKSGIHGTNGHTAAVAVLFGNACNHLIINKMEICKHLQVFAMQMWGFQPI